MIETVISSVFKGTFPYKKAYGAPSTNEQFLWLVFAGSDPI